MTFLGHLTNALVRFELKCTVKSRFCQGCTKYLWEFVIVLVYLVVHDPPVLDNRLTIDYTVRRSSKDSIS